MSAPDDRCPHCKKPLTICVCDKITPMTTRLRVLVLQHPQEDDVELGTAPLLAAALPKCTVRVGLSWASLSQALGEDVESARWAVIYPTKIHESVPEIDRQKNVLLLDRNGRLREHRLGDARGRQLEGIVILDGTWSQAKALWWRNAWLLKLNRIVLRPREPSIYGAARKEPRREYVSTLESVAEALPALGEDEEVRVQLRRAMRTMVQRARDAKKDEPKKPASRQGPRRPRDHRAKQAAVTIVEASAPPTHAAPKNGPPTPTKTAPRSAAPKTAPKTAPKSAAPKSAAPKSAAPDDARARNVPPKIGPGKKAGAKKADPTKPGAAKPGAKKPGANKQGAKKHEGRKA